MWNLFDSGGTTGQEGSENGTIIRDDEHPLRYSKPGTSVAPDRDPSSTVLQMFDVLLRDHRRNVTRPVQPPRPTLVKSGLLL